MQDWTLFIAGFLRLLTLLSLRRGSYRAMHYAEKPPADGFARDLTLGVASRT